VPGVLLNEDRARRLMAREGIDGLVAATLENNLYLSGVWHLGQEIFPYDHRAFTVATRERPSAGVVVLPTGECDLSLQAYPSIQAAITYGTFFREMPEPVELSADHRRIKAISIDTPPKSSALEALFAAIEAAGLTRGTLGVDERGPHTGLLDEVTRRFPHLEVRPASALFREIRMVKTPDELARLTLALRATEAAIRAVVAEAREGVTERELFRVFESSIVSSGARPGFTLIRFGEGMALAQVPSGDTALKKGDYIFFDVGCTHSGYRSDIGRVFAFGEPSDKLRRLCRATREGQGYAISHMRPGTTAAEIFHAAVNRVRECGIPHYRRHHVGHGIGIEYYDPPVLTPQSETPLETGMVFEVETPYYELGFGGAFIEDTVLVEEQGGRILTELSRDLQVIPV
jgi:Xaa-Pro dipeptidase